MQEIEEMVILPLQRTGIFPSHVKYPSCNMDAFLKNVFRNKTIRHGLIRLFHPSDLVDRKTRAYKVIKHPNLASVCNFSLQTTLPNATVTVPCF
jgi:hypothetical protein